MSFVHILCHEFNEFFVLVNVFTDLGLFGIEVV